MHGSYGIARSFSVMGERGYWLQRTMCGTFLKDEHAQCHYIVQYGGVFKRVLRQCHVPWRRPNIRGGNLIVVGLHQCSENAWVSKNMDCTILDALAKFFTIEVLAQSRLACQRGRHAESEFLQLSVGGGCPCISNLPTRFSTEVVFFSCVTQEV
eukprot:5733673-Amphidinium_carterae.1